MKTLAILAAFALASPAMAGTPVTLKSDMVDTDGVVTLGEIFEGAGAAANTPVAARTGASVMLSAVAVQAAARRAGLDWANAGGLRQIIIGSAAPTGTAAATAAAARSNVDVLTWTRNISAGEMIQPQDMVWGKAALAPANAATDPDAMLGMAARRTLRAGATVASHDVSAPLVIKTNDVVTLVFEDGGISLSLLAKALSSGAVGEQINVQNVTSKKTVQAVVIGRGQAIVGPGADQLKLTRSSRYAFR